MHTYILKGLRMVAIIMATILNPFYNMEYKILKKIRQNTAWIEADILGKNLTPNRCNALTPAIVYVSNDVTIPFNSVTSQ